MPRTARVVAEGVPHHITQRGNNRQDTFLLDEDRRIYLQTLRAKCRQHGVAAPGYCLLTNLRAGCCVELRLDAAS